jgi:hypothetical protein
MKAYLSKITNHSAAGERIRKAKQHTTSSMFLATSACKK